jgi:WhiB family transcriptional regulator, redox-sensing transcriptional regulator
MTVWREPFVDPGVWPFRSWRLRAACRQVDSAVFFSPEGESGPARQIREAQAKAICARCPVIRECAAHAITAGERHGVWGGLSERDRLTFRLGARL